MRESIMRQRRSFAVARNWQAQFMAYLHGLRNRVAQTNQPGPSGNGETKMTRYERKREIILLKLAKKMLGRELNDLNDLTWDETLKVEAAYGAKILEELRAK
jgi:hypothetical protein